MTQQELQKRLNLPYSTENWKEVVQEVFPNVQLLSVPQVIPVENEKVESFIQLGNVRLNDGKSLALFELKLKSNVNILRNRVELNNLVSQYIDQDQSHGVLSIFEQGGDDYRFTFSARATEFDEEEGDFITKKTDTKRYTYVLGKNESCKTPAQRLHDLSAKKDQADINTIQDAFSVEKLSKEFFAGYRTYYERMVNYLTESPSYKSAIFKGDEKAIRDFVKLTLGRLVFIQFLQKKRWIGVPSNESGWDLGDPYFLKHSFQNFAAKDAFYSNFLEPLFFETLNKDGRPNHIFSITGTKVPYLNGGLFEKGKENSHLINFPAAFFEDLFEFFDRYNFTIDESDPKEQEVGIDPEMLGHIFENLLEDNKDKGAFYTPKAIVHFMCQESLLEYLKTFLEEKEKWPKSEVAEEELKEALSNFIKKKEGSGIIDYDRELAIAFREVKICDPAIGSGAFPMGMLNEIFQAVHILFQASPDVVGEEWAMKEWKPNLVKKNIIQNSIYGVDTEKGAVDIARLRFWLSLIVDEPEPKALPNLDYKIVVGDSLVNRIGKIFINIAWDQKMSGGKGAAYVQELQSNLMKLAISQKEFFKEKNHDQKQKLSLIIRNLKLDILINQVSFDKEKYNQSNQVSGGFDFAQTKAQIIRKSNVNRKLIEYSQVLNRLIELKSNPNLALDYFDWKLDFAEVLNENVSSLNGFHIVIGNPPYLRIQGIREVDNDFADELTKKYDSATGSFDLYAIFTEKGLELTKHNGVLNYIMPIKWTNAAFGKGLRKVITKEKSLNKIINFGAHQVFNASTYTGLQWFKRATNEVSFIELDKSLKTPSELNNYLKFLSDSSFAKYSSEKFSESPWILTDAKAADILEKISKHQRKVSDLFEKIFQGIATSKDSVYFLYDSIEKGDLVEGFSKELNERVTLERGILKPLLKGDDVHRYCSINTNKWILFPYNLLNSSKSATNLLYTEDQLAKDFPKAYNYLLRCSEVLKGREKGRLKNDKFWYKYIYPKSLTFFNKEKLISPDISMGGNFSYDKKGEFYSTTTNYGYILKPNIKEGYKFYLAILNSKLMWWYLVNTGTVLANGYFRFKPDYLKPFPIPELLNESSSKILEVIADFVLTTRKIKGIINPGIPNSYIAEVFEDVIDALVFELYFPNDFEKVKIEIRDKAIPIFKSIDGLSDKNQILAIQEAYQTLREKDNPLRNEIKLMKLELKELLLPILSAK